MKATTLQEQLAEAKATIRALHEELADTNQGLVALSMELEQRVEARTAELAQSNAALRAEIAERNRVEEALRQSEEQFRMAIKATNDAIWDVNLTTGIVSWNETYETAFGRPPETMDSWQWWIEHLHPEDRDRTVGMLRAALDGRETIWTCEYRFLRTDGIYAHICDRAYIARDESGSAYRVVGAMLDLTERKRAEERLQESEQQFRTLADSIPNLAWWANGDGYITWYNHQWYEYTGTTPEQMEGWGWQSVHDPDELPRVMERWKASIATGEPFNMEFPLRGRDGQFRWFLTRILPLKDSGGRVVRWFGTNTDVTEVREARQAAEAANEAKSQFLANMSHELRTPMNAILGLIDVALPKAKDLTVKDCLQTAKGSADLLLTLLNDLLDSAKIESGKLELESSPFGLRRMLDQITRVLSVRASEKGLCFYCRLPEGTPNAVVGDRMRLQQILLNLAGNAIKFTERGGVEISVCTLSRDGDACLEFAVRDSGIGIPPASLENLFQPFAQADPSTTRRFGGTGLGLSICKSLVEMMGGRIWGESEVGKGSTFHFTVRLPLAKEIPFDFEAPVAIPKTACAPLRILLVEDNPANQKLATYILQDRGHLLEIAGDGQEAIYLAEKNRYDVILMDVQMPGMNGLEATAAIRKREDGGSRVPIIAMTAHAMKGDRDRCLAAGMDGYLSKPINAQEMIGLIESLAHNVMPVADVSAAMPGPKETPPKAAAVAFDPAEAITLCFNSEDLLREMVQCFFDEVDNLIPQMRVAMKRGDVAEVGRLGHRLKGTVVYLGAESVKQAAIRVELFCKASDASISDVEGAINLLERECMVLKTALSKHSLAAEPMQGDSETVS